MAFQNTSWTLLPLSHGGLLASKVANYILMCDTCLAMTARLNMLKCEQMISEMVTWIK